MIHGKPITGGAKPGPIRAAAVKPQTAAPRAGNPSPAAPRARDGLQGGKKGTKEDGLETPHIREVRDFIRLLVVAEKKYQLYPVKGQVVQEALKTLFKALEAFHKAAGADLKFRVGQFDLSYQEDEVYRDEERGKSVAYRMSKDSVRGVNFLQGVTIEEFSDFLSVFKEMRKTEENEDDFGTLFWEKDSAHIELELVDDFVEEEDREKIPVASTFALGFDPKRFGLDPEEEERLRDLLGDRRAKDPEGDDTFELTEEELKKLAQLAAAEAAYFPLYDFVDILIEFIVQSPDQKSFHQSLKLIQAVTLALIENLDFQHAAGLLSRLSRSARDPFHGLTPEHQRHFGDLIRSFCVEPTFNTVETFLKENLQLQSTHDVFKLMRAFDQEAVPRFCKFLRHHAHASAITEVLTEMGKGFGETFSRLLGDPDPVVAKAMMTILMAIDRSTAVEKIAGALQHPDESIRLHAARILAESGDKKIAAHFLQLLREEAITVLNLAIQFFAKVGCPEAGAELLELCKSRRFCELDDSRQSLCFKALVLSDPGTALSYLTGVLRFSFCFGKQSLRRKAAALRALRFLPVKDSTLLLLKFSGLKRNPLAAVANRVLQEMRRPPGRDKPREKEAHDV